MNLNPAALVILLGFDGLVFEPLEVLKLLDPLLERFFASIVKNTLDHCSADAHDFIPSDCHDNEHDQIEEGELENDKEAVEDQQEKDEGKSPEECSFDT